MRDARYGILFLLLLMGCASQKGAIPEWVVNPQTAYPPSRYLSSVGEGDTRRAAENSAAAGLARIFKSSIDATETLSEAATETSESLEIFSELRNDISISAQEELINIQFGEAYTAPDGRVHAVAFLPRAETATILRQRIAENSRSIVDLSTRSHQTDAPLLCYALRRSAARLALENELLLGQLDVIIPGSSDRSSLLYNPQELSADTASAAANVFFSVSLPGEAATAAREALTGLGFSERSKEPSLRVSGTAEFEEIDLKRDGLTFVRGSYEMEAHGKNGDLLFAFKNSLREGHLSKTEAFSRAARALRRDLKETLQRETNAFLVRLVE